MNIQRAHLVLHGSVILLIALACGLPSVIEVSEGTTRMWQAAHSALLLMGIWMFAVAGIIGLLVLERNEFQVLVWSLIAAAYSLAFAAIVQAATGVRTLGPTASPLHMSVFVANLVVVLGSVLSASLTLLGAKKTVRASRATVPTTGSATSIAQPERQIP